MAWRLQRRRADRLMGAGLIAILFVIAALWGFTQWQAARIAAQFPPTGRFIDLGKGARLHYTERPGREPLQGTVVLLHGASGNQADMMLPLGDRLAALGFRVIAPDRPGHGWSDRPDGAADASPSRQAALIRGALAQIGVDHAIVVGHSLAGAVAAAFALDQPDFTDGLVLVGPVLYPWATGVAWYYDLTCSPVIGRIFADLVALPAGLALMRGGIQEVFAPEAPPPDFAARTGVALVLRPAAFVANAQDVAGLLDFVKRQAPRMPDITVPTAIVTGEDDHVVNPWIHSVHADRDIPGTRLTLLHGVGHSPHWSATSHVIAAVLDVAARIRPRAQAAGR